MQKRKEKEERKGIESRVTVGGESFCGSCFRAVGKTGQRRNEKDTALAFGDECGGGTSR
jgi:hypothetical protein